MMRLSSARQAMLFASAMGLMAALPSASAQQATPLPPGHPLIGQPETEGAKRLAPVAPPPLPTAADKLPVNKLQVAKGFKLELYASGIPNARTLRQGDKGTIFVSNRTLDKIYAIVDKNGKQE